MGPTIFTHAARRRSTSVLASCSAFSSNPTVVTTIRAFAIRAPHLKQRRRVDFCPDSSLTSTVFCLFWRVPREKFFVFNYGLAPSENSDEWYQILYLHSLHVIRYIVPCVHSQNHQDAQGQKLRQLSPRRVRKHAQRSAAKNPLFPRKSCARPARALAEPGAPPAGQLGRPARPDDHGCVPGNRSRKRAARK